MASGNRRVFRFAPSPNGYLHLGHAFSALLNSKLARETGGRFLLRVEDIDTGRARPEFEAAIYEDLDWLGLAWEQPVRRQSEHFDDYARALETLDALGLLYACDCKRSDIARFATEHASWPCDPDGAPVYPGTCRDKPHRRARDVLGLGGVALRLDMTKAIALAGQGLSWRESKPTLRAERSNSEPARGLWMQPRVSGSPNQCEPEARGPAIPANPSRWGDAVLARKDTPASYHIAVVVDDALQGVTDVVRGEDLFHATSLHRLLQRLLGLPEPAYRHHALVRDDKGEKLSKSAASRALRSLRAEGLTPADVRRRLGFS